MTSSELWPSHGRFLSNLVRCSMSRNVYNEAMLRPAALAWALASARDSELPLQSCTLSDVKFCLRVVTEECMLGRSAISWFPDQPSNASLGPNLVLCRIWAIIADEGLLGSPALTGSQASSPHWTFILSQLHFRIYTSDPGERML